MNPEPDATEPLRISVRPTTADFRMLYRGGLFSNGILGIYGALLAACIVMSLVASQPEPLSRAHIYVVLTLALIAHYFYLMLIQLPQRAWKAQQLLGTVTYEFGERSFTSALVDARSEVAYADVRCYWRTPEYLLLRLAPPMFLLIPASQAGSQFDAITARIAANVPRARSAGLASPPGPPVPGAPPPSPVEADERVVVVRRSSARMR